MTVLVFALVPGLAAVVASHLLGLAFVSPATFLSVAVVNALTSAQGRRHRPARWGLRAEELRAATTGHSQ